VSIPPDHDWAQLGYDGNPVPGDPQVLQGIVDDFTYLRDTAWSVSQGLDSFLASASSGGFEGATADALRGVVSGQLKTFMYNVARSFSLAGEAVAEYRLALMPAQQTVGGVVSQAGELTGGDPKLGGLKRQVQQQVDTVIAAAQTMEQALRDAADMVSQPIKVVSLFEKIWQGLEMALDITAMALALLSTVVDGPLGIAAFGAGAVAFGMAGADYAAGRTNAKGFAMASLGLLAPPLKGMFTLEAVGAGVRALLGSAGQAGGKVADGLSSSAGFGDFMVRGAVNTVRTPARVPVIAWHGVQALPELVMKAPGALRDVWESASAVVGRDFASVAKRYPRLLTVSEALGLGRFGSYVMLNIARVPAVLLTPMTWQDIAKLGFRGAWAEMGKQASLTGAAQRLHAGWAGYRSLEAANAIADGLHGFGEVSLHAGDTGWHEPPLPPVTRAMPVESMLTMLKDVLQPAEFKTLFTGASGILGKIVRLTPVLGLDAESVALRAWQRESTMRVAYALYVGGEPSATKMARIIRAESGAQLPKGLLGRGLEVPGETSGETSGTKFWLPESAHSSGSSTPEEHGVPVGQGGHTPLVPAVPAQLSPQQLKPERDALVEGLIPTKAGLEVPVKAVFTPEAQQAIRQVGQELRERKIPLTGNGIGAMQDLSMLVRYAADGTVTERSLTGSLGSLMLFEQVPVRQEPADRLGAGGIAARNNDTGEVVHFDGTGHSLASQQTGTDVVYHDRTDPGAEEHFATDVHEALMLLQAGARTDPAQPGHGVDAEEEIAGASELRTAPEPGAGTRKSLVSPEKIAAALARVFASNFVADSGSVMLYQALSGQPVTFRADLRTGAFDALGTTVFAVGGATLAKGAGVKGPIGVVLAPEGMLGTMANGSVGNVVGGLVADWSNHQKPSVMWQDAVTNTASGAVGNAGSYAIARALKERNRRDGETISGRDKMVNAAIRDPLGTLMYTAAYTAGDVTEADVQNLTNGG
jgi:hypothetical protein